MRALVLALLGVAILTPMADAAGRPMKLDDLYAFHRVADAQISPDGKSVAYSVSVITDAAANKSHSHIWIAPTDGSAARRQLTGAEKKDRRPRWSPDGSKILFESNRSGEQQLWVIDLAGGEARQITTISTGASGGIWSSDGKLIAFVSAVYPENSAKPFAESDKLNKERADKIEKDVVKAKVFNRLFYRHWDSWVEDKRQHLFVCNADGKETRDVTPGDRDAFPTSTTFSTGDDFTFTPDSKYLVFTAVPAKDEAWNTNYDLCRVGINNTSTDWQTLTADNPAADSGPVFSPDGKCLAFRRQKKAGYEADKWELAVAECAADGTLQQPARSLTGSLDRSVDEYVWLDAQNLMIRVEESASTALYKVARLAKILPMPVLQKQGHLAGLSIDRSGSRLAASQSRLTSPGEVVTFGSQGGEVLNVSKANAKLLEQLDLPKPESVTVKGANGDPMQMWILKPPGFDPAKKWPVAYLVHGGPQGAWEDGWSFRWCPQLWAAQGYVVALPNPRGSTGFGQKYTDEITGDWGGKCYEDLMKGADYVENLPYVDKSRIASAGASFGGYMMNWFAVSTNRFKCLITHCSVYNFESMYTTTDEIWFDEWEHGGPPWGVDRKSFEKYSPHRFAGNLGKYKTPMLIIHNDLDFRCPLGQGQELFTALQRQGVPSRFVNFPDEGHWVTKPANGKRWHAEVFAWLTQHVPPGGR
ncbi:MAG: S9 family peptidase [Gemmataceae bacterium]|nr:S9 family peptidase [Gemmataceae bacterium]